MVYKKFNIKRFFKSFGNAIDGVVFLLVSEQNARVHTVATIAVGILAYIFRISRLEAAILFIAVILVFAIEIINTAVEKTIDLLHPENHATIRGIKDAMAGAVFISAIIAVVSALLVFMPHIRELFK